MKNEPESENSTMEGSSLVDDQSQKKPEVGVKINPMAQRVEVNEEPVVERENPYLYATGGPKKVNFYGAPEGGNDEDLASYDLDSQIMNAFGDDTYKVKYSNEKFRIGPMPSKTLAETQEEKE